MHQLPNGIRPSSIPLLAPILLALLSTAEGGVTDVQGLSTVSYVNDAASLDMGARLAGLAGVSLAMPGDPSFQGRTPAGLSDVTRPEVVVHHGSLYEDLSLTQDELYLAAPLQSGVLGVGVSRVGADGIIRSNDASSQDLANASTFSAADWIGTLAFSRAWLDGRLRGGASLRLLARSIDDHAGGGAEMDASFAWADGPFRAGLRFDHGMGSFALWRSGYAEYSAPNAEAGLGWEQAIPYFYGDLSLAWETPGLLQPTATNTFSESDARPWKDPWLFARASRLATEFRTDFGLVLRAGCEIQALVRITDFLQGHDQQGIYGESSGLYAFGAGYLWSDRVRIDYSLVGTPDLGTSQRVSLALVFGGSKPAAKPVATERSLPREVAPVAAPSPNGDSTHVPAEKPASSDVPVAPAATPAPAVDSTATPVAPAARETPAPTPPAPKPVRPASDDDAPEQLAH
jgi:hypothetical protein